MKKMLIISVLLLVFLMSCGQQSNDTILTIDGVNYTANHFYRTIPSVDFNNLPANKQKEYFDEYILKKLATIDLTNMGILDSSQLKTEIDIWKFWHLVNFSYEKIIADKIITEKNKLMLYDRLGRELQARQLLISYATAQKPLNKRTHEEAKELIKKIQKQITPSSFATFCKNYSDDKHTKNKGGVFLAWIKTGSMLTPVDSVLFSIKKNVVSAPVKTPYGYHFLMVDDSRKLPIKSYDEEQANIKRLAYQLWETKFNNMAKSLIDSLKTSNPVTFYADSLSSFYKSYSKLSKNVFYKKEYSTFDIMEIFNDSLVIGKIGEHEINKQWILFFLKTLDTKRPPRFTSEEVIKSLVTNNQIPFLIHKLALSKKLDTEKEYLEALDAKTANLSYDYYNKYIILNNINPSEKEKKAFYNTYKDSLYKTEKMVVVKEILVSKKKLADSLLICVKGGEDIGILAKKYSERNIGKFNDGKLPPIHKGQYGKMGENAFLMKIHEIAGPFKVGRYYSIIQLEKVLPTTIKPYDNVKLNIKNDYIRMNITRIQTEKYNELKSKHKIIINNRFFKDENDQ